MRKLLLLLALITAPALAWANQSARGWCELGGQVVVTSGLNSTTTVQASYPACTVTVNVFGGGLATIFSDNSGTPLANPFTATSSGQWTFFAANGHYTVTLTGGGLPSPVTLSDILLNDPTGPTSFVGTFFSTASAQPAQSGVFRLASADIGLCWRNNANTADICFTKDTGDVVHLNTSLTLAGMTSSAEAAPSVTGVALGDTGHRWDAFIRNLDVSGTITGILNGSGTANAIPKFTAPSVIGNSSLSDDGATITGTEPINIGTNAFTAGAATLTSVGAVTPGTGAFTSLTSTGGSINGTIGAITPSTGVFTTTTADTLNGVIKAGGTTYACTASGLNNALKALPPPSGVVDARGCSALNLNSDIFSGVANKGVIYFPCSVMSVTADQNWTTGFQGHGCAGAVSIGSGAPTYGTVFKWAGGVAPTKGVLNFFDVVHTNLTDVSVDCNNVASCTGINIDSNNTPITSRITFDHIIVMNAAIGFQIGTANGVQEADLEKFTSISCYQPVGGTCFVVDSANAAQAATFSNIWISGGANGWDFQSTSGGFIRISDCAAGSLTGAMVKIQGATTVQIENCQNESGGSFVVDSGSVQNTPLTLIENVINQPVSVTSVAQIISIGNHYTTAPSANNNATITAIGDKYDAGATWSLSGNSKITTIHSVLPTPKEATFDITNGITFSTVLSAIGASISGTGLFSPGLGAIASLTACSSTIEGAHAVANNCNAACTVGGTCTAGGATHCEVYCNGTNYVETGR